MMLIMVGLFAWSARANGTITVAVVGEQCVAILPDYHFTINCPGPKQELVALAVPAGLHYSESVPARLFDHTQLESLQIEATSGSRRFAFGHLGRRSWRERLSAEPVATLVRQSLPRDYGFTIRLRVRRPEGIAGLALVDDHGQGHAFVVDASARRGVWWTWKNGDISEPLGGAPWQRDLTAQIQSQVQRWLAPGFSALVLLGVLAQLPRPAQSQLWQPGRATERWLLLLAVVVTFGAALAVAVVALERVPHVQDSVTTLFQAQTLARGELWAPPPSQPRFFEQEFLTVHNGKWFGQYLPAFPALLVPGVWLDVPWIINPLLAGLTVPLIYWLAYDWGGRRLARWVLLLLLSSPFFLVMSGTMMVHAAELFWATLFMLSWARYWRGRGWRWGFWAGVSMGVMALTRPVTMVSLLFPYAVMVWLEYRFWCQKRWVWRSLGPTLLALPLIGLTLLYQFQLTGDPWQDPRLIQRPFDRIGFGPEIGEGPNVFELSPVQTAQGGMGLQSLFSNRWAITWRFDPELPPRGHTLARGVYNIGENWRLLEVYLLGWVPGLTMVPVWLGLLRRSPRPRTWRLLVPLGTLLLVYVGFWATGRMYGPRYFYTLIPSLLILLASGFIQLEKLVGFKRRHLVQGAFLLLVLGNALFFLPEYWQTIQDFNFVDGDLQRDVAAAVERPALVFVAADPMNWWEYGSFFSANTPWLDGDIVYARDLGPAANASLLDDFPGYLPYIYDGVPRPGSVLPEASPTLSWANAGPPGRSPDRLHTDLRPR